MSSKRNKRNPKRTPAFQSEFAFAESETLRRDPRLIVQVMCVVRIPEQAFHPSDHRTCYADHPPEWLKPIKGQRRTNKMKEVTTE
jgi:hypothetical protein